MMVKMREGIWYLRRDGKIVGPAKYRPDDDKDPYPWIVVEGGYTPSGHFVKGEVTPYDLIREVPAPVAAAEAEAPADPAHRYPPGDGYRVRDGRAARVYAADGGGDFPIHGAIETATGKWTITKWSKTGSWALFGGKTAADLMPKRREVWVKLDLNLTLRGWSKIKPEDAEANGWVRFVEAEE